MSDRDVFESIKYHKLRVCPEFEKLTDKQFAKIYNGYGPDAWPKNARKALTWVFGNFKEVAGSHDITFYFSTGTRKGFNKSISDWKYNSSVMLNAKYPLSSPTLWGHRVVAWTKLRLACKAISGREAYGFYLDAYIKRTQKKPKASTLDEITAKEMEGLLT